MSGILGERLGHSSISVTLDPYSHVVGSLQDEAASRVDDAIGGAINKTRRNGSGSKAVANRGFSATWRRKIQSRTNLLRPRGGVVTQRSAKPFTPVQFRPWPPLFCSPAPNRVCA